MHTIQDIIKFSNLKDNFVRRCIRDMNDILKPYIERGEKNKLLLDPEIIPIFAYIKQNKDKGLSLSTIKNNLLSSDIQLKKDTKTNCQTSSKTDRQNDDEDEWLSIKNAAKLAKRSETTIRRLIPKLKVDPSVIQKEEGEKGKWLVSRKYISENFDHNGYTIGQSDGQCSELSIEKSIGQSNELFNEQSKKQVIELLEKQIEDLQEQLEKQAIDFKEQLKQKDAQLEKQTTDFKEQLCKKDEQLNQKDQQIHQLHVLLKESKTSTIDYKPDENLGVFSKVLVKFGL